MVANADVFLGRTFLLNRALQELASFFQAVDAVVVP
jgi:hypothetical protein